MRRKTANDYAQAEKDESIGTHEEPSIFIANYNLRSVPSSSSLDESRTDIDWKFIRRFYYLFRIGFPWKSKELGSLIVLVRKNNTLKILKILIIFFYC